MSSPDSPTVVCVLGMSRTGTSLTARVLNLAGVYLGAEEELLGEDLRQLAGEGDAVLARARDTNPEGFWEHYRLMRLNERILRRLGGSWREPPTLTPGWEDSERLAGERDEARALLAESFAGHGLWGWKDPRNCLTLPFWQQLVGDIRCVICLRNPVDVAASLQRRDEMRFAEAVELWETYLSRALANTADAPRLLVPYESYFERPRTTAARLAAFCGRDGAFQDEPARGALEEAVNPSLWRNRTSPDELSQHPRVPPEAVILHELTEQLAAEDMG